MLSRLRAILEGYRWLWQAQFRWHTGYRWLIPVLFTGRVILDAVQLLQYVVARSAFRATLVGLVALGTVAVLRDGPPKPASGAQQFVAVPPVLVNGARLRIGDVFPPQWRMAGSCASAESCVEMRAALDSLYAGLPDDQAGDLLRAWDLDPWRRVAVRVGPAIATISLAGPLPEPTRWPTVNNVPEVQRAIASAYPMELRQQGRGGTVAVQFLIGTDGSVLRARIQQRSGHPELDEAALSVARVYRFAPATHDGRAVESWATAPISFRMINRRS